LDPTGESDVTMKNVPAIFAMLLCAWALLPVGAGAQISPSAQRGQTFLMANCSRCHAVDKVSPSPLAIAPPFRTLHLHYPVENLQEALAEGIRTGHPNMPAFQLAPDQINDVISYLKTLER
jgi:cytochrome c